MALGQNLETVLECSSRWVQTGRRIGDEERPTVRSGLEHGCVSNMRLYQFGRRTFHPHPRIKYGAGSNPLPEGEGIFDAGVWR